MLEEAAAGKSCRLRGGSHLHQRQRSQVRRGQVCECLRSSIHRRGVLHDALQLPVQRCQSLGLRGWHLRACDCPVAGRAGRSCSASLECGGGRQIHEAVRLCDWCSMPLATAGVELPKHLRIDEVSVLPILRGREATSRSDASGGATATHHLSSAMPPCVMETGSSSGQRSTRRCGRQVSIGFRSLCTSRNASLPMPSSTTPSPRAWYPRHPDRSFPAMRWIRWSERVSLQGIRKRVGKMLREPGNWFEEVDAERATIDDRVAG